MAREFVSRPYDPLLQTRAKPTSSRAAIARRVSSQKHLSGATLATRVAVRCSATPPLQPRIVSFAQSCDLSNVIPRAPEGGPNSGNAQALRL